MALWCGLVLLGGVLAGCRSMSREAVGAGPVAPGVACLPREVAAPRASSLERDVGLLRSPDFAARNHAAERLVSAGGAALAPLGRAGQGVTTAPGSPAVSTTGPVLRAILEDLGDDRVLEALDAPWPVVRASAAEELGRRGRWSPVPHLIARMDDTDAGVRESAALALRRLTNRFFGFDAHASLVARRTAATRWRSWWAVEGKLHRDPAPPGAG